MWIWVTMLLVYRKQFLTVYMFQLLIFLSHTQTQWKMDSLEKQPRLEGARSKNKLIRSSRSVWAKGKPDTGFWFRMQNTVKSNVLEITFSTFSHLFLIWLLHRMLSFTSSMAKFCGVTRYGWNRMEIWRMDENDLDKMEKSYYMAL